MQCSKETLVRLFYNVSTSFQLLFLFFFLTSISLAKFFTFLFGNPFSQRNEDEYELGTFSEEEEEEEEEHNAYYYYQKCMEKDHLVADIIHGGTKALSFLHNKNVGMDRILVGEIVDNFHDDDDPIIEDEQDEFFQSVCSSPASKLESNIDYDKVVVEDLGETDTDSDYNSRTNDPNIIHPNENRYEKLDTRETENVKVESTNFDRDNFFIFEPPKLEKKKKEVQEKEIINEEIFGDTCTVGSTSKNSSEWRSSINCRDSGTEDPFSSSSRRSCPKWESYTVFQKYDEEMLFLDRISAQKLHETESLRSIQACPRSISERIVHKLSAKNRRSSDIRQNPYQELEGAYVAQICLTWEALNWNYKYFHRLRASRRESDPGCPAYIAQQFQQFQVLLQRYVENEPYEHGRRPEVYARMRSLAPKLLQVPEYRDSDEEKRDDYLGSRISSTAFLQIMEEAIRTFMNFLKADKENHCQIIKAFFRRKSRRGLVDPTLILLQKKVNKKKTSKVKDIRRGQNCIRKRKLKEEEEMEIVMALIDLKVVSRVLKMTDLSEEQLHWCEDKMTKVRVGDGRLQRDSSPLFFPSH